MSAKRAWPGRPRINGMRLINAVLGALSMVLIAVVLGAVLYLAFDLDSVVCAFVAVAALSVMVLYASVSNRLGDRQEIDDRIADLSRGTGDIARQVAEISRRLCRHGSPPRHRARSHAQRGRSARRGNRRSGRTGARHRRGRGRAQRRIAESGYGSGPSPMRQRRTAPAARTGTAARLSVAKVSPI